MGALLVWVDIVIVLVLLHLLVLLLHLPLVLLHLLGSIRIVAYVVQVHLLLDVDVVLGGGSLLLCLHHHLVTAAHGLVRIDCIGIGILLMLSIHLLPRVIHHEMTLITLIILLVAARIWILARSISKGRHNHVLNVVVYRQIYRRLLHLRLLLRTASSSDLQPLLAATLVLNWLLIASVLVVCVVRIDV